MLNLYYKIGFAVCHQLASHSIIIGGVKMPVDARDTGIYLGLAIGSFYLICLTRKKRECGFPNKYLLAILILSIAAVAVDGLTSYLGLRETTNTIRLATGLAMGFSLPLVLIPLFNYHIFNGNSTEKILSKTGDIASFFSLYLLIFLFISTKAYLLKYLLPTAIIVSLIITFWLINILIIGTFPKWFKKINRLSELRYHALWAAVLTIGELGISYQVHRLLLSLLQGA